MDLKDRIPCPSESCTTGFVQYSSLDKKWVCNQCAKKYSEEYIKAFYAGVTVGAANNKAAVESLKTRLLASDKRVKRLEGDLRTERNRRKPTGAKVKSISAADVKRLINEDARRKDIDRKTLPNPKDIDEYLLWTGAKIKRDDNGPTAKYHIKGYAADGHDVDDIIDWLHAM